MITRKSLFASSNGRSKSADIIIKSTENKVVVEEKKTANIDFTEFEIHLEDGTVLVMGLKTKNYKIKRGYLYKGLFKKVGKIKFIRIRK